MRIVVIGGGGLIGARLVKVLQEAGHDVRATSPGSCANAPGERLVEALVGAEVLVDVASPPSFQARSAMDFLVSLSRHLLTAEAITRVQHHVVLSMIGVDRAGNDGYFSAKAAQEHLVRASPIPYTIVRSSQCLEFIDQSLRVGVFDDAIVRLPVTLVQPIAAEDLAEAVAAIATTPAKNGPVEVAGPEPIYLHELARLILSGHELPRRVVATTDARYFGAYLGQHSLMPGPDAQIGSTTLRAWLRQFIAAG